MLTLWLAAGVLGSTGEVVEPPIVAGIGGYGSIRALDPDENDRLERAIRDMDRAIKQARTPRIRRQKLGQAITATETAMATVARLPDIAPIKLADLSDVHQLLIDLRAGILAFPDWRMKLAEMARAMMIAAQIEADEDDEDAMILFLMA